MSILVGLQHVCGFSLPILEHRTLALEWESRSPPGYSWCWRFVGWADDGDIQVVHRGQPRLWAKCWDWKSEALAPQPRACASIGMALASHILENANELIVTESVSTIAWGWWGEEVWRKRFQRATKKLWGVMDVFFILIVVIASWVCHTSTLIKWYTLNIQLLYLSFTSFKLLKKKKKGSKAHRSIISAHWVLLCFFIWPDGVRIFIA